MPTALTDIVKRFNDEGKKSKQSETSYVPIFSKYEIAYIDNCFWWISQYRNGHHIDNYGETNKITVTGDMSLGLVSLIPPTKALCISLRLPRAMNVPYFLAKNVPNERG